MRKRQYSTLIGVLFLFLAGCKTSEINENTNLINYVDPFIGSDYHGHVFVGASVPFGAVQLGPENFNKGWDWCSGYHYTDTVTKGFSMTHLSGTGCADLGDILIMPYTGDLKLVPGKESISNNGYASTYKKENEIAEAGYYSTLLDRYNIKVELTASERVGVHKYTFPKDELARIIVDLKEGNSDRSRNTYIEKFNDKVLKGYRISDGWAVDQRVYFAIEFSKPFQNLTLYNDTMPVIGESAEGKQIKGVVEFEVEDEEELILKIGISPVSMDNAYQNLIAEVPGWNFEDVKSEAQNLWRNELSKVSIKADQEVSRTFYTSLYHTMIFPSVFNDVNGEFLGADKKVYANSDFTNYTTFSLWDTYRAANPLFTVTQPERVPDFINSMLALYEQEGQLPEWHLQGHENSVMIGYNAVPIIVDAYFKGITGFDIEKAYEAIVTSATLEKEGIQYLNKYGFIPFDKEIESVAKALEYAIYDWGIAQMAKDLGKDKDYQFFLERANNFNKYFDSRDRFFKGKNSDGSWRGNFDPIASSHREDEFCEGNGWQYLWLTPQNVEGLIELLGGSNSFVAKLDSLFDLEEGLKEGASVDISGLIGMYAHGNEPSHHIPYLYAYAGQQWKTAEKVRQIMNEMYTDKPDGLCGNEDCGQMSAWYVWSAMGFYPVNPMNGAYVFGSPQVQEATIALKDNKAFTIIAHDNSTENIYIQSVKLNGNEYTKSYITHKQIMNGGKLEFFMGSKPNKSFGSNDLNRPKSIMY